MFFTFLLFVSVVVAVAAMEEQTLKLAAAAVEHFVGLQIFQ
jgi:hypothetical protein